MQYQENSRNIHTLISSDPDQYHLMSPYSLSCAEPAKAELLLAPGSGMR